MNKKLFIGILAIVFALLAAAAIFISRQPAIENPASFANDEVVVIANLPFVELPDKGKDKPSWNEIRESLPALKNAGVNAIFLWGPWERAERVDSITAYTEKGEVQLPTEFALYGKDYLKPDPDRGSEAEFLGMIESAHSLGMKVISHLQITITVPGGFVYDRHPEWMLESIYGKPAAMWPWAILPHGYAVNKAHPELISYVTETIIPHWVKKWNVDGILLDSPAIPYADLRVKDLYEKNKAAKDYDPLTPVDGYYGPEPLVKAMRAKIDQMKKETGKNLIFAAEATPKTWQDMSDESLIRLIGGDYNIYLTDPAMDRSLGSYFDWVWDYNFRPLLRKLQSGAVSSGNYAKYFEMERKMDAKYTKQARFVNMWNSYKGFADLLMPKVAGNYLTLAATAPGEIIWIDTYQLPLQTDVLKSYGYDSKALENWYKKLISIKKKYASLQSDNIEDALISPKAPKLIAYNRWEDNESATVIVSINDKPADAVVKTRFEGQNVTVRDLLSGETFSGDPANFKISVPAYGARILIIKQ